MSLFYFHSLFLLEDFWWQFNVFHGRSKIEAKVGDKAKDQDVGIIYSGR